MIRSEVRPRRLFAAFPGGGEVFAIGVLGRMPLRRLVLEVAVANVTEAYVTHATASRSAAWMRLVQRSTGRVLHVVPPGAAASAWMVMLGPPSDVSMSGDLFCVDARHGLYSWVTRGYVNLRGEVLLRGHGDDQTQAAGRINSSRVSVLRVPATALGADDAYWRCMSGARGAAASSSATSRAAAPSSATSLRVLTYATQPTAMLCDSLLVALHARVPLTLLGFGELYAGNFQKLRSARAHVRRLPAEALVLFADAYDVLYAGGAEGILERWRRLNVSHERILFQGERGCWPDWDMGPHGRRFCEQQYPASPTPYRYVNSGVWMGHAAVAARLLTELVAYTPGLDDQHVTGHIFVDYNDRFVLDQNATLFQSMHGDGNNVGFTTSASDGAPTLFNALTHTLPLVLHFNGGAKELLFAY